MHRESHDDHDGKKVWLNSDEINKLLSIIDDTEHHVAIGLMARCGLRTDEVTSVTTDDVVYEKQLGKTFVRVEDGKGGKYRETPMPDELAATTNAYADVVVDGDGVLIDRDNRTLRRWIEKYRGQLATVTDDTGWRDLSAHDLRRSWGNLLATEEDVESGLVMEWGGWENWETFREHYLGAYSVSAQREYIEKVEWL